MTKKKRKTSEKSVPIPIRLHHNILTQPQIQSLVALFHGDAEPYYRECRKVNKTIITIQVNHSVDTDKWAKGMLDHYREVVRVMESFYRLYQANKGKDMELELGVPING